MSDKTHVDRNKMVRSTSYNQESSLIKTVEANRLREAMDTFWTTTPDVNNSGVLEKRLFEVSFLRLRLSLYRKLTPPPNKSLTVDKEN